MRFDAYTDDQLASSLRPTAAPAARPSGAARDWPGERCCATFGEAVADLEAWVLLSRARAQVEADEARRSQALCR
jgi:hypothetical protein